ncbi:hypothetical protein [Marinobacter xiaoshiensis]|uniref:DNA binding domain-containing protein, excisionase family n=1 Tax=Marinobacter xiaoshiensis TaxID=3073652 RepID=A0ABU2HHI2_9GAMM|nr:hypothetical protein [Marinobacter sp. F60267]MDS1310506.1 hypothetical protein [Marinobacter sp. F60267]
MRQHQQPPKRSPGWFSSNNQQFLALSQVPQALKLTASEVADAAARGELEIVRISGCKAVALSELYRFIDKRGEQK